MHLRKPTKGVRDAGMEHEQQRKQPQQRQQQQQHPPYQYLQHPSQLQDRIVEGADEPRWWSTSRVVQPCGVERHGSRGALLLHLDNIEPYFSALVEQDRFSPEQLEQILNDVPRIPWDVVYEYIGSLTTDDICKEYQVNIKKARTDHVLVYYDMQVTKTLRLLQVPLVESGPYTSLGDYSYWEDTKAPRSLQRTSDVKEDESSHRQANHDQRPASAEACTCSYLGWPYQTTFRRSGGKQGHEANEDNHLCNLGYVQSL